jgi:hypothetical protein
MTWLISESVSVVRTHSTCVWSETLPSGMEWHTRVHIRGLQGLWYLASRYRAPRPTSQSLFYDTYCRGIFSVRPFFPGLPSDPSTDSCVLALVCDLCRERGVEAAELIQRAQPARPRYSWADLVEARHQADWERTDFPVRWTAEITAALCRTLEAPAWGDLAQLVSDLTS